MSKAESFVELVEDYFYGYENEELTDEITAWARKNCTTFTCNGSAEQPLHHTDLFNDYCALFEKLIENFLDSNNMSTREFYNALQEEQGLCERRGNMKGLNATFGSVLLSATDYMEFCQMMYDINQGGEAVFCPPLVDCDDDIIDNDVKSDFNNLAENKEDFSSEELKSQCK